jgi:RNA-directed DNA polymerase
MQRASKGTNSVRAASPRAGGGACAAGGGLPPGTGDAGQLHRWAGGDPSRRFGDLFNLVYDPDFLAEAWLRVKGNAGSRTPGIDAATVADVETRIGVGAFFEQVRELLKSGEFRPVPVRQVMIPKAGSGLRKLGIPTEAA